MIYTRETRDLVKELGNKWVFFSDNLDFKPYYEGYLNDVVDDEYPFEAVIDYDFIRYFKYLTLERPKRDDIH